MSQLFAELKRRHVYRVAVAYAVTAWLLMQLAAIVLPTFGAPHWVLKVLIGVFVLFFPVAILLAWAFEVTPGGVRRTVAAESDAARPAAQRRRVGRMLDFVIIAILAAAVGVLAWRQFGMKHAPAVAANAAARAQAAASVPAPHTVIPAKSIAVLPFANDSGDPDQRYFSDGLSEDLILALNQYPGLIVIGRESSFQFRDTTLDVRQIGKRLGVAHLLEGSVSRVGGEVRVRAELVDTRNGHLIWSDHYDRLYEHLFSLQDDITKAVATALKAKLLGRAGPGAVVQTDRPPSGSMKAYDAYLKGNFYFDRFSQAGFRTAIGDYRQAVALDPRYVTAYAALAYVQARLGSAYLGGTAKRRAYSEAAAAVARALALDPSSAEAHRVRGFLLLARMKWAQGLAELRRAFELAPNDVRVESDMAVALATQGRIGDAIRLVRKALGANPLSTLDFFHLSQFYAGSGRFADARRAIRQAIALRPASELSHAQLAAIDALAGHGDAALPAARQETDPVMRRWALALAYAALGNRTRSDAELHDLVANSAEVTSYQIAEVFAFLGQSNQAFDWLDRAWRTRDPGVSYLLYDPFLLRYKNDPRFAAFCRKVGLPVPRSAGTPAAATP